MKKLLITGANGQLGNSIRKESAGYPQFEFIFTDVEDLNLCNESDVDRFVTELKPYAIINCAAYTAVDKAEEDESLCKKINSDAVAHLGKAASKMGAKVIHVSTDYVFDGTSYLPYNPEDPTAPVSVYGKTKLEGEERLQEACPDSVIIRTAWLYSEFGNNFVKTMLRYGREREEMRVVFDQIGTPTYAGDLANAILKIVSCEDNFIPGVYHYTNEGVCSWYDFAVSIYRLEGLSTKVVPIETKDYPTKATRPHYSVLNKAKIKTNYKLTIPHWEASLENCLQLLKQK